MTQIFTDLKKAAAIRMIRVIRVRKAFDLKLAERRSLSLTRKNTMRLTTSRIFIVAAIVMLLAILGLMLLQDGRDLTLMV